MLIAPLPATTELIIRTSEPRPATPWYETTTAKCGRDRLDVTRPLYPLGGIATIRFNGRAVRGNWRAIQHDLSEVRAAYRISVLCSRERPGIAVRWVRGLADGYGHVNYRSGSFTIQHGVLVDARAEDSSEESFWYR